MPTSEQPKLQYEVKMRAEYDFSKGPQGRRDLQRPPKRELVAVEPTQALRETVTHLCRSCGRPILGDRKLKLNVKYCSDACRKEAHLKMQAAADRKRREQRRQEEERRRRYQPVAISPTAAVISVAKLPGGGTYMRIAPANALGTAQPLPVWRKPSGRRQRDT